MKQQLYKEKIDKILFNSPINHKAIDDLCIEAISNEITIEEAQGINKSLEKYPGSYGAYKLYKYIGDKLLNDQSFEEAFVHYVIAMDIVNEMNLKEEKNVLFNNMGVCKLNLLQYDEAIYYFNCVLILSNTIKNFDMYTKSMYNMALSYLSIFKEDEALGIINKCYEKVDKIKDRQLYIKLKILEANCYDEKRDMVRCLNIYEKLLEEEKHMSSLLLGNIYNNMALIKLYQKEYEVSRELFDKAYEVRRHGEGNCISHTIIDSASLYYELRDLDEFFSRIERGIILCREENDYEYLITALLKLEKVYKKLRASEKLREIYLEILSISEKNALRKNIMYALNKLISLEISLKNFREAYKYNEMLNSYIENIVNN